MRGLVSKFLTAIFFSALALSAYLSYRLGAEILAGIIAIATCLALGVAVDAGLIGLHHGDAHKHHKNQEDRKLFYKNRQDRDST